MKTSLAQDWLYSLNTRQKYASCGFLLWLLVFQILMSAAMETISVKEMQTVSTVLVVTAVNVLLVLNSHPMVLVLVRNQLIFLVWICLYVIKRLYLILLKGEIFCLLRILFFVFFFCLFSVTLHILLCVLCSSFYFIALFPCAREEKTGWNF